MPCFCAWGDGWACKRHPFRLRKLALGRLRWRRLRSWCCPNQPWPPTWHDVFYSGSV